MLIIGGAFGTMPDPAFDHANSSHWYVASYLTVVIAAVGLAVLRVHVASYRERGVLRRGRLPAVVVRHRPAPAVPSKT